MRFLQNDYIKQRAGAKTSYSLIKATGGSDGIRDEGILDMALNNPFQAFGGKELYPGIQAKAARLCFGLVKNHAMLDGNKRLGTRVMLVFLALNGYELSYNGLLNIGNKLSAFESEIN